ncbi:hypothetical protein TrCOL_g1230 [Triparma columacea]|uniref:Uncharacterized protein n=1 Tax=Triparma columacea TaxID=722753 RepID=A0A9W7LCQ0_9STRA|nr:hypothetical protein TrCOL_g1230 [Triparma columacea]
MTDKGYGKEGDSAATRYEKECLRDYYRRIDAMDDRQGGTRIRDRVNALGGVRVGAFGKYGEAGSGMMKVLNEWAKTMALKSYKSLGLEKPEEAVGWCRNSLVRTTGIAAWGLEFGE